MRNQIVTLLLVSLTCVTACRADDRDSSAGVYIFEHGAVREVLILYSDGIFGGHLDKFNGKKFASQMGGGGPLNKWTREGNLVKLTAQGPYAEYYIEDGDLIEMKRGSTLRRDDGVLKMTFSSQEIDALFSEHRRFEFIGNACRSPYH